MTAQQTIPQEVLKYIRLPLEMLDNKWATSSDVVVYAFMLNRYLFFKNLGKSYYENVDDIAKGCRLGTATVTRTIKKLQENNYIKVSKVRVEVGCSNSYVVEDIHKVNDIIRHVDQNDRSTVIKPKQKEVDYEDLF